MKKSVTKIMKATIAVAMAIGAGVGAAASNSKASPVYADTTNSVTLNSGIFDTDHITWTLDGVITIQQIKGTSASAVNSSYISAPRVYKGHILSFVANDGYVLKSISITVSSTYYGNSMTAGIAVSDDVVTDNTTAVSRTWANTSGGTHVVGSVSSSGLSEIYIQNVATGSNVQLRPTAISITYSTAGGGSLTATETTVSATENKTRLDISLSPKDTVQLNASVTYNNGENSILNPSVTWNGNNNSVATVNASGMVTAVAKGVARFTASYAGDSTYDASAGYIDITVYDSRETIFDFADLATERSWEDATAYTPVVVDGVSISTTSGGNNAKYYASDHTWRMYNGGSLTVTPPAGKSINAIASSPSHSFNIANDGSSATASFNATVKFASITVTLAPEKVLDSISASITNTSRVWRVNDVVYAADLTVTPHYTDGSDGATITNGTGVTVTNGTITVAGNNIVNVSYGGKSTTVIVNALSSTVVEWTITGSIGETVKSKNYSLAGLTLHAWYDAEKTDEASSSVADLYELVADPLTAGSTPNPDNVINVKVYLKTDTEHTNCLKTFSNVAAPIANSPKGSIDNPYSIAEARQAIDDNSGNPISNVYVEGIISQIDSYNGTYRSITYWISDDGTTTNQFEVYSGKGIDGANFSAKEDIEVLAAVLIHGTIKIYNTTYEFNTSSEQVSYVAPTDETIINFHLRSASSFATINGNETFNVTGSDTANIVFANQGLSNDTQYPDPFAVGNATITFGGGANDGKYYTTGSGIRTYGDGSITVTSTTQGKITGITFTWSGNSYKPESNDVADCGTYNASTGAWSGSSDSVTLTRPSGNGHWRLQSVSVTYESVAFASVDSVALRFGVSIPTSSWDAINAYDDLEITDYGVMYYKTKSQYLATAPSVESLHGSNPSFLAVVRKGSGTAPTAEEENYPFTARINYSNETEYDKYIVAAPFIVINNTDYYFICEEMRESVRTLAVSNDGTNLSTAALSYLAA